MQKNFAMPETGPVLGLSDTEKTVLEFVLEFWPSSALDVAEHFGEDLSSREKRKKASSKYSYHIQKLVEKKLLLGKRVGNAMIVWPLVVEKYRAIHNILRE